MKEEEGIYLKELNIYIIKLLNHLWNQPKLIADLLIRSDLNDIKNNLASFIGNFFYENLLSPYYIQDNLLYVLTIILKKEINDLKSPDNYNIFLSKSCAGYILNELKNKNELKIFFRNVINKTVLNLEIDYSQLKLNFSVPFDIIEIKKEDKILDEENDFKDKLFENKTMKNKYFISLTEEYIIKKKQNNINKNNNNKNKNINLTIEAERKKSLRKKISNLNNKVIDIFGSNTSRKKIIIIRKLII